METIVKVQTFQLTEGEQSVLGQAVNILADVADFIEASRKQGVAVEMPEDFQKLIDIYAANLQVIENK